MDYGKLLSRAWNIVWEHKFLILLGVLVTLSGVGGGSGVSSGADFEWRYGDFPLTLPPEMPDWETTALPAIILFVGLALVIGVALWVVSTIARGGLIAGASAVDSGAPSSFAQAWSAGWQKGWTLLGIGILPAIPSLHLLVVGLGLVGVFAGLYGLLGDSAALPPRGGLGAILAGLVCIAAPIALALSLLRTFANRACMLEDLGVFAAYRRGWDVLLENVGPALILFLLQVAISIGLGIALFLPNIVMALCCVLWPVLLLVQGAMAAYFSTVWTLAWREWTGG
jgi:hypothetical protein